MRKHWIGYALLTALIVGQAGADSFSGYPIGASGASVPLLNTANTWSAGQTFNNGITWGPGSNIVGSATNSVNLIQSDGSAGNTTIQFWGSASANPGLLALSGATVNLSGSSQVKISTVPLTLAKLGAAPTGAPGAGNVFVFAVAGTTGGTCKLQAMAGTSTTPTTILDNIGSGC